MLEMPRIVWARGNSSRDCLDGVERLQAVAAQILLAGTDRQRQGVKEQILGRQTIVLGRDPVEPPCDLQLALAGASLTFLVNHQRDHAGAKANRRRQRLIQPLAAVFQIDRVNDRFAAELFQSRFKHRRLCRIEHQRQRRKSASAVNQFSHVRRTVAANEVDTDIRNMCAFRCLVADDIRHLLPFLVLQ